MYDSSYCNNFLNSYISSTRSDTSVYNQYIYNSSQNESEMVLSQNTFNKLLSDIKNIERF